uniref:MarR family winged helix-turn-helix transcriptional regulator n=1 Tax=Agathobacter sp. TaxID=2021311 RepID=UPI0040261353
METRDDLYEDLFRAMNQFHKLKFSDMMQNMSKADFIVMNVIMNKGKDDKMTISELAAIARMLPSAISRTLRGLEEKGYVERTINKNDRRNTYVELTAEGKKQTSAVQREMRDFGKTVMAKLDEQEMNQLILYLNNIYSIAEKELEARKIKDRKEREHE